MSKVIDLRPMLATVSEPPIDRPGEPRWRREFEWDGERVITEYTTTPKAGAQLRFISREGNDITRYYPEVQAALAELLTSDERSVILSCVLDGEFVALDDEGRPALGLLQHRMRAEPRPELVNAVPVSYYLFDVLDVMGRSVRDLPYTERRELLEGLGFPTDGPGRVLVPPSFTDPDGQGVLNKARDRGLRGIVSKQEDSKYVPGRHSPYWRKTLCATSERRNTK